MDRGWESINIHGVRVDALKTASAAAAVAAALAGDGEGVGAGGGAEASAGDCRRPPIAVFTPNAEIIYRCSKEERLADLVNLGDLNLPDGVGVSWGARALGTPLPGRIPGIELGERALEHCAASGIPVYLLGGREGVAASAAERLAARFPGLSVCGNRNGYFDPHGKENEEVLEDIRRAEPGLLIVCLGFPRQEEWIIENRAALPGVGVMMGLGGSLDVWSGGVRRAPALFRRAGLEWLWRIFGDAGRLRRAGALPGFVFLTLRRAVNRE